MTEVLIRISFSTPNAILAGAGPLTSVNRTVLERFSCDVPRKLLGLMKRSQALVLYRHESRVQNDRQPAPCERVRRAEAMRSYSGNQIADGHRTDE